MKKWIWFVLSGLVILGDQASKQWVVNHLEPYQAWNIYSGLNITLAFNPGVAFSVLSQGGMWGRYFFSALALVMSLVLTIWLMRLPGKAWLQSTAISLILGGALGNVYDRIVLGQVTDFIDVYYKNHHWPIFNVADSAICIGAVLLIIDCFKKK